MTTCIAITWSDSTSCYIGCPHTPVITCGSPPTLTDGSVDTSSGTTYQSVAVYQCNEGYTLQGQAIIACQEDGTWSGTTPTCACESSYRASSDITKFIIKSPKMTLSYVTTATIHPPFSHSSPVVDCGSLDDIPDGTVSTPQGTLYRATASYSCNTGYRLVGNGTRECQADGRWSGEESPYCGSKFTVNTVTEPWTQIWSVRLSSNHQHTIVEILFSVLQL